MIVAYITLCARRSVASFMYIIQARFITDRSKLQLQNGINTRPWSRLSCESLSLCALKSLAELNPLHKHIPACAHLTPTSQSYIRNTHPTTLIQQVTVLELIFHYSRQLNPFGRLLLRKLTKAVFETNNYKIILPDEWLCITDTKPRKL